MRKNTLSKLTFLLLVMALILSMNVFIVNIAHAGKKEEAAPGKVPEEKPLVIGHVNIWNIGWYAYLGNAVDIIADKYGVEIARLFTDYTVEKELQAVEDMITRDVDGIILGSTSADSCQRAAQLCNDADIPLVIENSSIAPGPGKVVSDVEFDWRLLGRMMAEETAKHWPGSRVVIITGVLGTGPIDLLLEDFNETAEKVGIEVVKIIPADYMTEKALTETQNLIQSGLEFDVIWGNCQEMTEGIIEAFKSAGILGEKIILSTNGGPMDVKNLEEGELDGCINYSPGFHGLLCFLTMYNYLTGEEVPELTYLPMKWIDPENLDEVFPWEMDASFIPLAEQYMETGSL